MVYSYLCSENILRVGANLQVNYFEILQMKEFNFEENLSIRV
jgi:hypothetical protein